MRQLAHLVREQLSQARAVTGLQPAPRAQHLRDVSLAEKFHGDKVVGRPVLRQRREEHELADAPGPPRRRRHAAISASAPAFTGTPIRRIEIEYVATDEKRQEIPYVRLKGQDGKFVEFRTADGTDEKIAAGERRRMDCVDCHNRPTHDFFASPERAVDVAMARGAIPSTMPFARRQVIEAVAAKLRGSRNRRSRDREAASRLYSAHARARPRGAGRRPRSTRHDRAVPVCAHCFRR